MKIKDFIIIIYGITGVATLIILGYFLILFAGLWF